MAAGATIQKSCRYAGNCSCSMRLRSAIARLPSSRARAARPRAPPGPRPRCGGGGLAGHGSAVVVDDLDVVAIRVEHEGAVVARVVHGALAGGAVYHPGYY